MEGYQVIIVYQKMICTTGKDTVLKVSAEKLYKERITWSSFCH